MPKGVVFEVGSGNSTACARFEKLGNDSFLATMYQDDLEIQNEYKSRYWDKWAKLDARPTSRPGKAVIITSSHYRDGQHYYYPL